MDDLDQKASVLTEYGSISREGHIGSQFEVRPANIKSGYELDWIASSHQKGFTEEPYAKYCYPHRVEHDAELWKYTREMYESLLKRPDKKYLACVLEAAVEKSPSNMDVYACKIVGVAVWDVKVLTEAAMAPDLTADLLEPSERVGANRTHCAAFRAEAAKRFTSTSFAEYGAAQVHLCSLVVDPKYQRQGGGKMLVDWGIQTARELPGSWPITLCVSPTRKTFFERFGFREKGTETVRCEGEKECLQSTAMVLGNVAT